MKKKLVLAAVLSFWLVFLVWPTKETTPTASCSIEDPGYIVPEMLECIPPEKIEGFGGGFKLLSFVMNADSKEYSELKYKYWDRVWLDKDSSFNLRAALIASILFSVSATCSVYLISKKNSKHKIRKH